MTRRNTMHGVFLLTCTALMFGMAHAATEARKCDKVLADGRCVQIVDGKVLIDGQEQQAKVVHSSADMPHTTLPAAPAGVERIAAIYDKAVLSALFKDHEASFNLPQFYVVDLASGEAPPPSALPKPFAQFVKDNGSDPKDLPSTEQAGRASLLGKLLAVSRNQDGSPLRKEQLGAKKFAAFQLWADWCTGCMQEASELSALLKQHPMPGLAWIALETDPMKAMDMNPANVTHSYVGPNGKPLKLGADGKPIIGADGKPVEE